MQNQRFRTIFGEAEMQGWTGVNLVKANQDTNILKSNDKYIGLSSDGGKTGCLCILRLDSKQRITSDYPMIRGHQEPILDFEFFPFNPNYVATCSGDTTIKIWNIPDDLQKIKSKPESTLFGHEKKINVLQFNPVSEGVLASSGLDNVIKIWDVIAGKEMSTGIKKQDYSYDFKWKDSGDLIASIWKVFYYKFLIIIQTKDQNLRLIDPRKEEVCFETKAHKGARPSKVLWMGKHDKILTLGFSKNIEREIKIWDIKKPDKPFLEQLIDKNYGVMMPYYDSDLDILWLTGKGDNSIKYFEYTQDGKLMNYFNDYKFTNAAKGITFLPKRVLDVKKTEIAKCAKLSEKSVHLVSFITSRKSDVFQQDLYPDCVYDLGQNGEDFFQNKNAENPRRSMNPEIEKTKPKFLVDLFFKQMEKPPGFVDLDFIQGDRPDVSDAPKYGHLKKQTQEEQKQEGQDILSLKETISKLEIQILQKNAKIQELEHQVSIKDEQLQEFNKNKDSATKDQGQPTNNTFKKLLMHHSSQLIQNHLSQQDNQVELLKQQIERLQNDNNDLSEQYDDLKNLYQDQKNNKNNIEELNEQLREQIEQFQSNEGSKITDLENQLEKILKENKEQISKIEVIENQVQEYKTKSEQLMESINEKGDIEGKLKNQLEEIFSLKQENKQKDDNINDLNNQLEILNKMNDEFQQSDQNQRERIIYLEDKIKEKIQNEQDLEQRMEKLLEQLTNSERQVQQKNDEIDEIKRNHNSEIEDQNEKQSNLLDSIADLKQQIQSLQIDAEYGIQRKNEDLEQLKIQDNEFTDLFNKQQTILSKINDSNEKNQNNLDLKEQIGELTNLSATVKQAYQNQYQTNIDQLKEKDQQISELNDLVKDLKQKNQLCEQKQNELQEVIIDNQNQNFELQKQIDQVNSEKQDIQKRNQEQQNQQNSIIQEKDQKINHLQQKLEEQTEKQTKLDLQIEESLSKNDKLQNQIQQYKDKLKEIQEAHQLDLSELQKISDQHDEKSNQLKSLEENLKEQKLNLQKELDLKNDELQKSNENKNQLDQKLKQQIQKNDELKQQLDENKQKLETFEESVLELTVQNHTMQETLEKNDPILMQEKIKDLQLEINLLQKEASQKESQILELKQLYDDKNKDQEKKIYSQTKEIERLNDKIKDFLERHAELIDCVNVLEEAVNARDEVMHMAEKQMLMSLKLGTIRSIIDEDNE